MKSLDELVSYYGEQLGCGELSVDAAILYNNLLTMKDICDSGSSSSYSSSSD